MHLISLIRKNIIQTRNYELCRAFSYLVSISVVFIFVRFFLRFYLFQIILAKVASLTDATGVIWHVRMPALVRLFFISATVVTRIAHELGSMLPGQMLAKSHVR